MPGPADDLLQPDMWPWLWLQAQRQRKAKVKEERLAAEEAERVRVRPEMYLPLLHPLLTDKHAEHAAGFAGSTAPCR